MSGPNAIFFDGRAAGRVAVAVELESSHLSIRGGGGESVAAWPYASLRIVDQPEREHAGVFASDLHETPRLIIADPALFRAIEERMPAELRRHSRRQTVTIVALGTAAAAAVAVAFWLGWAPLMDRVALAMPRSWEAMIGRPVAARMVPEGSVCAWQPARAELGRLVERLARAADTEATFTVTVVESKVVNAFAAPGGFIVLHSALLDKAAGPDEVAGVLAHEMAHVIERHTVRLLARQYGLSLVASALVGQSRLTDSLTLFQLFAYSREFEAEADARAIAMLKAAGLRAGGLAAFFQRHKKQSPDSGILAYFSTHPPTAERRALAERAGARGNPAMTSAAWTELRAICARKD